MASKRETLFFIGNLEQTAIIEGKSKETEANNNLNPSISENMADALTNLLIS